MINLSIFRKKIKFKECLVCSQQEWDIEAKKDVYVFKCKQCDSLYKISTVMKMPVTVTALLEYSDAGYFGYLPTSVLEQRIPIDLDRMQKIEQTRSQNIS